MFRARCWGCGQRDGVWMVLAGKAAWHPWEKRAFWESLHDCRCLSAPLRGAALPAARGRPGAGGPQPHCRLSPPALCTASEPPPAAVGHVESQWYRGAGGGPAGSWEMEHLRPLAPLPIPMTPGQASSTTPSPHEPGCDSLHTGAPDPPPGLSCFRRCSSGPFTCSWPPQGPAGSTTYVLVLW